MTTAAHLIRSAALAQTAEYASAAVTVSGAQLVFCAGACPLDTEGNTVGVGDVRAQTRQVMANLQTTLADANAEFEDIVVASVYVASSARADLVAAWEIVRDALAPHDPPSTLLGVTVLGYKDQLVEVDAVAAIKG